MVESSEAVGDLARLLPCCYPNRWTCKLIVANGFARTYCPCGDCPRNNCAPDPAGADLRAFRAADQDGVFQADHRQSALEVIQAPGHARHWRR